MIYDFYIFSDNAFLYCLYLGWTTANTHPAVLYWHFSLLALVAELLHPLELCFYQDTLWPSLERQRFWEQGLHVFLPYIPHDIKRQLNMNDHIYKRFTNFSCMNTHTLDSDSMLNLHKKLYSMFNIINLR